MIGKGVKEYFNLPEKYFSKRSPTVNLIEKLEEKWFLSHMTLNNKEIVLDFACGSGRWSKIISKKVKKIYSIDISPKPIQSLKTKKLKNVRVIIGSDNKIRHINEQFDKIIFAQGLEFYSNPKNLLIKFRNALKENGELFISTWTPTLIKGVKELKFEKDLVIVRRPIDNKKIKVFCKLRTKKEVKDLLRKLGYKKIQIELLKINSKDLSKRVEKLFSKKLYGKLGILIVAKATK